MANQINSRQQANIEESFRQYPVDVDQHKTLIRESMVDQRARSAIENLGVYLASEQGTSFVAHVVSLLGELSGAYVLAMSSFIVEQTNLEEARAEGPRVGTEITTMAQRVIDVLGSKVQNPEDVFTQIFSSAEEAPKPAKRDKSAEQRAKWLAVQQAKKAPKPATVASTQPPVVPPAKRDKSGEQRAKWLAAQQAKKAPKPVTLTAPEVLFPSVPPSPSFSETTLPMFDMTRQPSRQDSPLLVISSVPVEWRDSPIIPMFDMTRQPSRQDSPLLVISPVPTERRDSPAISMFDMTRQPLRQDSPLLVISPVPVERRDSPTISRPLTPLAAFFTPVVVEDGDAEKRALIAQAMATYDLEEDDIRFMNGLDIDELRLFIQEIESGVLVGDAEEASDEEEIPAPKQGWFDWFLGRK